MADKMAQNGTSKAGVFVLLMCTIAGSAAFASVQEFPWHEGQRLVIDAQDAQVVLTGSDVATSLRVVLEGEAEQKVSVTNTDQALRLEEKISDIKSKDAKSKVRIEVSGKPSALEIHVLEGSLTLNKWSKDTLLHLQKGKVVTKDTSGNLAVHLQKGELSVAGHQGKLIADLVQANANIKEGLGDIDLSSFQGDVTLDKNQGVLNLQAREGNLKVIGGEGAVQFDSQKANMNLSHFAGRIEGVTGEGAVTIAMDSDQEVLVRSSTGKVTVASPANSGAMLNLSSSEGDIYVPAYLKVSRDGVHRSLRGRLKGEAQSASIFVRSQEGIIIIK